MNKRQYEAKYSVIHKQMADRFSKIFKTEESSNHDENIGKHNDVPDSKFNKSELKKGISSEKEHTGKEKIAKSIAKDHLSENPKYYTKLNKAGL